MKTKYPLIKFLFLIIIIGMFFPTITAAQPAFRIPIIVIDSMFDNSNNFVKVSGRDTLFFGVHPSAVICFDADTLRNFMDHWYYKYAYQDFPDRGIAIEEELPPVAFGFDPRMKNYSRINSISACLGQGTKYNIHGYSNPTQSDSFRLAINYDTEEPITKITLKWPSVLSQYADSIKITAGAAGTVRMDGSTGVSFIASSSPVNCNIVMFGPKIPPPIPSIVQLTSPNNGDTLKVDHTTLQWNAVANAIYYRVLVGKDTFFTSNKVLDTIITSNTFPLSNLKSQTRYYWKVYVATEYGLSFFQSPPWNFFVTLAPEPPIRIAPTNGATNIQLDPTFIWHKPASASPVTYRFQLATDTTFLPSAIVKDSILSDTTIHLGSILQNCIRYYWRVNASNADGTGAFTSAWNFRTILSAPSVPILSAPADDAIDISLSPTLTWTGDVCSDNYRLLVGLDLDFNQIVANVNTNQTSYSLSGLLQDTMYYWKVKAKNANDSSEFSTTRKFRTLLLPAAVPTLVSPANGDTTQEPIGTLIWRKVQYADKYHLQISRFQNFSSFEFNDSTIIDTFRVTNQLMNCSTYYWKVRAINRNGSQGFSTVRNFRIKTALPGSPVLLEPTNNKDSLLETVTLRWQAGDACTKSYFYHVSQSISFTDTVAIGSTNNTEILLTNLRGNVYYYWRVRARNYLGDGAWSETFRFHTIRSKPDVPVLLSPPNGAGDMPSCITFVWDSAAFAETYRLQIAFDSAFTNLFFNDSTIQRQSGVQPSKQVCGLLNSRTYYWRVNAKNDIGTSDWSVVRRFITLYPPSAPTLNSPENGAIDVSISPLFVWSIADRANVYQLQVSANSIFSPDSIVFSDSTITQISWQVNWLQPYTKYYWRVRGKNSAGWGPYSSIWDFRTTRVGPAKWLIPITVAETGPERQTIYFGEDPNASKGLDPSLGEYELPPAPFGFFDARFISPYIGEGLLVEYHKFYNYSQKDTFQFMFQPGMGSYPMKISWPLSRVKLACDSMIIEDRLISPTIRARMDIDSTFTVNNSTINSLYIVMYGAFPLPVDVKPVTPEIPSGFVLYQNYPNPFNPSTKIHFSIDKSASVSLKIYDMLGQEVSTLANSNFFPGSYTIEWNGTNEQGLLMPSGVYYIRMIARAIDGESDLTNTYISIRKMLMMK